jgi:hypothetical protein
VVESLRFGENGEKRKEKKRSEVKWGEREQNSAITEDRYAECQIAT